MPRPGLIVVVVLLLAVVVGVVAGLVYLLRRWAGATSAALAILACLAGAHYWREARAAGHRQAGYNARLEEFQREWTLGMSREESEEKLRAKGIAFQQQCCLAPDDSQLTLDDVVKIGEEEGPFFCDGTAVNVVLGYRAGEAKRGRGGEGMYVADAEDVLQVVRLRRIPMRCL